MSQSPTWLSYDSVADTYVWAAVPWFTPLVRDLVGAASPGAGERVLDLGTGTGLVARLAAPLLGPDGLVVGADPSGAMLAHACQSGVSHVVVAKAPGFPFPGASFDLVLANLVLSHLPDLALGCTEIAQVLRAGGRLGATAWADEVPPGPRNELPEADQIVASVRHSLELEVPPSSDDPVPWEDELRRKHRLRGALNSCGFEQIEMEIHRYERARPIKEFLSGWGSQSRYTRYMIGEEKWNLYTSRAIAALSDRFGESIRCSHDAWVVTAHRTAP